MRIFTLISVNIYMYIVNYNIVCIKDKTGYAAHRLHFL